MSGKPSSGKKTSSFFASRRRKKSLLTLVPPGSPIATSMDSLTEDDRTLQPLGPLPTRTSIKHLEDPVSQPTPNQLGRRQSMGSVRLHQEALIDVERKSLRASVTAKIALNSPSAKKNSLVRDAVDNKMKQLQQDEMKKLQQEQQELSRLQDKEKRQQRKQKRKQEQEDQRRRQAMQEQEQEEENNENEPHHQNTDQGCFQERGAVPKARSKQISIDITPSQGDRDLVPSLLIAPRARQGSSHTPTTPSGSICSSDSSLTTPGSSLNPSPRLDDIRERMAQKEAELKLRLKNIGTTFSALDDDLKLASTRSLPAKNKPVPMLSLFVAREMVHEETEEGAEELDYVEQARQIAQQIKQSKSTLAVV